MADNEKKTLVHKTDALPAKEAANTSVKSEAKTEAAEKPAAATKKTVQKTPAKKSTKIKTPVKKAKKATTSKAKKSASSKKAGVKNAALKPATGNAKSTGMDLFANPQTMEKMMTQNKAQMDKITKEATDLNRQAIEAVVKSTNIFAKGCEEMMRISMGFAQDASTKQTQFLQEAMSSKTFNEWTEVQNKFAQSNFDDFVSGATKISGLGVKTLSDAIEPINTQMTKTVEKASNLMAA